MSTDLLIPTVLVIPLSWGVISLLLRSRWNPSFALLGIVIQAVAVIALSAWIYREGSQSYGLAGWEIPLGIELVASGLSVTLLALTALIALICALYALFYLRSYPRQQSYFWPLFWFLLTALNGIWLAADLFNLYVGLELLTLAAVGLVALNADKSSLEAGLRYLYFALFGSLLYLLGVALLYGGYGTLALTLLPDLLAPDLLTLLALACITLGLLMKTAIFPFHFWLPPAHGGALAPVSALLSALVVKASFYIIAVIWLSSYDALAIELFWTPQALGFLGACAIAYGSWRAFHSQHIKMLVAWSTVAQLGYLMLFFPLAFGTAEHAASLAWQGTLLHLLAHGFAKAAMFLSVGTLVLAIGSTSIKDLAGISRQVPMSLFAFGLSAVSLMGLPPSGGFNAKWLMLQSALSSEQWWWVVVILAGGLATAAYIFRVFSVSFETHKDTDFKATHPMLDVTALLLASIAIALGFFSMVPLALMELVGFQWLGGEQ